MRLSALMTIAAALASSAAAADQPPAGPAQEPDPDVQELVKSISPERIQRSIFVLASFKTRHTLSDPLPSGDGIGGAGAWVRAEFERASADTGGRLKVDLDTFDQPAVQPALPRDASITNIVATLPGTDPGEPERTVVVTAHYDSIPSSVVDSDSQAPGADDDASGVAAVLEMARQMARYRFKATIIFLVVAGEEQGLFGSAHWAQAAKDRGANIEAVIAGDIIGSSRAADGTVDRSTVRLFAQGVPALTTADPELLRLLRSGGENDTAPRELARAVREIAACYVPAMKVRIIYRTDRILRGSDHISFLERGYPAVRLAEPAEDFRRQHQNVRTEKGVEYGDVPDHVDFAYTADVARVAAAALAQIARAPAPPSEVQLEAARLENDSTLRWAPAPDPSTGHRIVWRETTAPNWEHSLDVPKGVNRFTVASVSKDNVVFGVEAVDPEGHASPAVFPSLRRTL